VIALDRKQGEIAGRKSAVIDINAVLSYVGFRNRRMTAVNNVLN
jgi:hypothetical protein